MTPKHHPSEETLARHAAGTLPAGIAIVVGAHVSRCAECRREVGLYECVGGALLETAEPTALETDALARTLALIDRPARIDLDPQAALDRRPIIVDGVPLPETLRGCSIGRWRWIGPGVHMSKVDVPFDRSSSVFLLKVGAGRRLPDHGHTGLEFTYVLKGSFSDAAGRFMPGDLEEADAETEHQPIVDADDYCICLAAMDGTMRLNGLLGRLIQPFVGI